MMVRSSEPKAIAVGLKAGQLAAYPCEGLWGLGCDPHSTEALRRLLHTKQRGADKGLIVVAGRLQQLREFVVTDSSWHRAQQFWPAAVTCIVTAAPGCPDELTGGRGTIAVRLSEHKPVVSLCEAFGGALTSSSANRTGQTPCRTADELEALWGQEVEWLYDSALGDLGGATPIVDAASGRWLRRSPAGRPVDARAGQNP